MGSSHMRRVAIEMVSVGAEVVDLSVPGWVATRENIAAKAEELKNLDLAGGDCVVVDLWSNSTFLGSDENGYPLKPTKSASDGRYHVVGDHQVAPQGVFKRNNQNSKPIFESINDFLNFRKF